MTCQYYENRGQTNTLQNTEQQHHHHQLPQQQHYQQQNMVETLASPSPSTKKGSFFKKNVEDGMDRVLEQVNFQEKFSSLPEFKPEDIQSPSAISINTPAGSSVATPGTTGPHSSSLHGYRKKSVSGPHRSTSKYNYYISSLF